MSANQLRARLGLLVHKRLRGETVAQFGNALTHILLCVEPIEGVVLAST